MLTESPGRFYCSGENPKFSVDDTVSITYRVNKPIKDMTNDFRCDAIVLSVSDTANQGMMLKEFTYSVKILSVTGLTPKQEIGKIYDGIWESCLKSTIQWDSTGAWGSW